MTAEEKYDVSKIDPEGCIVISSAGEGEKAQWDWPWVYGQQIGMTVFTDKETGKLCGCAWQNKGDKCLRVRICKKHFMEIMKEVLKREWPEKHGGYDTLLDRVNCAMGIVHEYGKDEGYF